MSILATALTTIVVLLHLFFLVLEMFLWTKPYGRRVFGLTPEVAASSATLAANQGLYNGFLAAGLVWGSLRGDTDVVAFFLCCVVVAGIFGAATANRRILWFQALPGAAALAAVLYL